MAITRKEFLVGAAATAALASTSGLAAANTTRDATNADNLATRSQMLEHLNLLAPGQYVYSCNHVDGTKEEGLSILEVAGNSRILITNSNCTKNGKHLHAKEEKCVFSLDSTNGHHSRHETRVFYLDGTEKTFQKSGVRFARDFKKGVNISVRGSDALKGNAVTFEYTYELSPDKRSFTVHTLDINSGKRIKTSTRTLMA